MPTTPWVKIGNVSTLLGPTSSVDGDVAVWDGTTGKLLKDLSLSALLDAAIGSTRGAVLYRGASGWAILAPGTAGQFLKTAGADADPLWALVPGSTSASNIGLYSDAHFFIEYAFPTNSVMRGIGCSDMTSGGSSKTFTNLTGEGLYQVMTTTTISGQNSSFITTNTFIDWSSPFDVTFILHTGSDITNVRYWFGIAAARANSDDIGTRFIGFRYSTNVPDGGWVGVTNDGSNQSVTATAVAAIASDTRYKLRVRWDGSATASFSVNGGTELSLTTTLPSGTTRVGVVADITTLAAAAKTVNFQRAYGYVSL